MSAAAERSRAKRRRSHTVGGGTWLGASATAVGLITGAGEATASYALSEREAGSDAAAMRTRAKADGDGWILNGSKCFITNGGYADWFTVYAKTDKEAGHRGISCFIVPRDETVTVDKKEDKMGQRASNTATISFDDVEVPAENLLGEENKGFKLAMMTLDRTRPGVAAMAVGIARAAFEFATDYSKERVQFGVPIAMHQAIQFMIADMATEIEAARLLVWRAAWMGRNGVPMTGGQGSMSKLKAGDVAMWATTALMDLVGPAAGLTEHPLEPHPLHDYESERHAQAIFQLVGPLLRSP